jgi:pimeloyl-ACP methyl ester carboxylesterase
MQASIARPILRTLGREVKKGAGMARNFYLTQWSDSCIGVLLVGCKAKLWGFASMIAVQSSQYRARRVDQQMPTSTNEGELQISEGVERPEGGFRPAHYASRFIQVGGQQLRYLDYGTPGRPPILCVHGGAAHAHWFDFFAPGFIADFHVRALDFRGHGNSQWMSPPDYTYERHASDLAEVAEKLDLRDFVLMGHSMGGLVSLLYAATYPGRIRGLIIVDSTLRMPEDRVAVLRNVGNRPGSTYATHEEFLDRYRLRPDGTTAAPEIIRHLAERGGRQLPDGSWTHKFDRNVYAQRNSFDGISYCSQITIPTLVVKGGRSPRVTPELFAEAKARCAHFELAEVPYSNHHVFLDNPPGFERVVKAFLTRHG